MIPVKPSNNQQNCNPISSNCVTWQGPDIACINLQKGDTISDVTYKLAVELCDLLDQTNLDSFDLTCFDPICPKPENFHDLVQFIIDKLCTLNNCCSGTTPATFSSTAKSLSVASAQTSGTCPDCIITIASCFHYTDQFGNNITTMNIADYAAAIGAKVCTLATQYAGLQTTVSSQGQRITSLETWVNNYSPTIPTALSSCLYPNTVLQVTSFCQSLEQEYCNLRNATGTPTSLITAISRQCDNLDNLPKLYGAGLMGMTPGWVLQSNYASAADAINNLWLTVCDLRAAVDNILNTCCNDSLTCNSTSVSFGTITIATSTLSVPLLGTTSVGAVDCTSGIALNVSDKFGNTYTLSPVPAVVANLNGSPINVNLAATAVQYWSDLDVSLTYCIENTNNIACTGTVTSIYLNPGMTPTIILDPLTTPGTIYYTFANPATAVSAIFYVQLFDATETILLNMITYVNDTTVTLLGQFDSLTASVEYKVRIGTQIGTYVRYGAFQSVIAT
jgi:hypothetical protein